MHPVLETERLRLSPPAREDAPALQKLAARREIADTTISVPHPYHLEYALEWISACEQSLAAGQAATFAIKLKPALRLIGVIGLRSISAEHSHGELSFWIGVDWWGKGYVTEAATAVLQYGFESLGLNRLYAHHMVRNPASGRVMQKLGLRREALMRQCVRKWGTFEDVALWAILKEDWRRQRQT